MDEHQSRDNLAGEYHNLGSLEGWLYAVAVAEQPPAAVVRDRVSRELVHCGLPREDMERVKGLQGKRVRVTGDIHYTADGIPHRIANVVAFEDATPPPYAEIAEFGSVPDEQVSESGAAEWLKIRRGRAGTGADHPVDRVAGILDGADFDIDEYIEEIRGR